LITSTVEICIQHLGRVEEMVFAAQCSYASAVLGVIILSVKRCFVTNPKNLPAIFLYHMKGQSFYKCDFSYSCAAADKISTDIRARAVSLRQLSYLFSALIIISMLPASICTWVVRFCKSSHYSHSGAMSSAKSKSVSRSPLFQHPLRAHVAIRIT